MLSVAQLIICRQVQALCLQMKGSLHKEDITVLQLNMCQSGVECEESVEAFCRSASRILLGIADLSACSIQQVLASCWTVFAPSFD